MGPSRIVRQCNPTYERMLGFAPGELIGHPAPLPESEKAIWEAQELTLRSGLRIVDYKAPRLRKDGSQFPALISAKPLIERDGSYLGLVGTILDTSAESKLQMFASVVQSIPDPIGLTGIDLRPIFVNRAGQERFGLDGDDHVLQMHTLDYVAEADRARVRDELLPLLLAQGQLTQEILSRNLKTGEVFPALWTFFVLLDQQTKEPSLLATVVKDISERKRIEEELHRQDAYLKEGQKISHTGSWTLNRGTGEAVWSEEMFRILGLDPETTRASPSIYLDRIHPEDREVNKSLWRKAVEDGASIDSNHRIVRPDGTIRYVRRLGHRNHTSGNTIELIGTIMDVTEQHEREAELQRLLQQNEALKEQLHKEVISLHEFTRELQVRWASSQRAGFEELVGSSPALQRILAMIERVAKTDSTVLIVGETGTGKELVAHAIHEHSNRARIPLVTVNCASLTTSIACSELFGHEKGAFTGAHERHLGHFEVAKGGTIFLDEVGELALEAQAALLRVLDDHVFKRAGGTTPIRVDVRVLAATNRDLEAAVAAGIFREDLYYRLRSFPIELPPLRERREDIPLLVDHFIKVATGKYEKTIQSVDKRSLEMLTSYHWPGNVRELQKVIETSVILCDSNILSVEERLLHKVPATISSATAPAHGKSLEEGTSEYQQSRIEDALLQSHGQVGGVAGAANLLGVPTSTLRYRIKALKIDVETFRAGHRSRDKAIWSRLPGSQ